MIVGVCDRILRKDIRENWNLVRGTGRAVSLAIWRRIGTNAYEVERLSRPPNSLAARHMKVETTWHRHAELVVLGELIARSGTSICGNRVRLDIRNGSDVEAGLRSRPVQVV